MNQNNLFSKQLFRSIDFCKISCQSFIVEFILNKNCLSRLEGADFENISIEMQLYKQLGEKKLPIIPKNQEQSFLFARFIHLMVRDKRHLIYEDYLPFYEVVYRWGHHDA